MSETRTPVVPPELLDEFDDSAREAHLLMASSSYDELISEMPAPEIVQAGNRRVVLAQLLPKGDYDESGALVLHLPYANVWEPHMYLRARLAQQIAAPTMRTIIFGGHRLGQKSYDLTDEEMLKVSRGDTSPIAELHLKALLTLGIAHTAIENYSGYSGGAIDEIGLATLASDYTNVSSLGMFEAPNATSRSKKELAKAFKKTGLGPFVTAIADAKMPALNKAMGIYAPEVLPGDIKLPAPKLAKALVGFGLASVLIKENRALKDAMAQDNLSQLVAPLLRAQPNTNVLLGNGESSRIFPTEDLERHFQLLHQEFGSNVQRLTVSGYGHEMADNIVAHALLVKKSLKQAS